MEQQLIEAVTRALLANLMQVDEWLIVSNAIAAATAEALLSVDATDAVRLEMVDELAQGIRARLGLHRTESTLQ